MPRFEHSLKLELQTWLTSEAQGMERPCAFFDHRSISALALGSLCLCGQPEHLQ